MDKWGERIKKFEQKQREAEIKRANMAKKTHSQQMREKTEYQRSNTTLYSLRVTNHSGIPSAVNKACEKIGQKPSAYLRQALIEKLQRDGYIAETPEE